MQYKTTHELLNPTVQAILYPETGVVLPWFPTFSHYLGGLRPKELTLLCAGTGVGKTALLSNISAQLHLDRVPHFCAPIETGDTDFVARIMSVLAQDNLNNGLPHPVEKVKTVLDRFGASLSEAPAYIATYENRVEVSEMVGMLKYMHNQYGIRVALLDNLNFFLKVTSSQLEKAEMDNAIHEFIIALKDLPVHVILIVHPKKTDHGRVESEFDIKGSSTAVQEAANVILFNRPTQEHIERGIHAPTDRELIFKKIRKRGEFVNRPIYFRFNSGRFSEK